MKPSVDAYTVAMPWYDECDFDLLWSMAHDHGDAPDTYAEWLRLATLVRNELLARGRAVEVVTIKPDAYFAWLGGRPNTAQARLLYVEWVAAGAMRKMPAS